MLLLEAGPPDKKLEIKIPAAFNKLFKSRYDWAYETEPQPNLDGRRRFWPRGKTLGGSSSLNAMMYVRGNALDYDHWEELGQQGMVVRRRPPLLRALRALRTRHHGPAGHQWAAQRRRPARPEPHDAGVPRGGAGHSGSRHSKDINGPDQDGVDTTQVTQKRGHRWSAADAYLKPAKRGATSRSSPVRTRDGSSSTDGARSASSTSSTA